MPVLDGNEYEDLNHEKQGVESTPGTHEKGAEMIRIEVQGLDKLKAAFATAAGKIRVALRGAGDEAAKRVVLPTPGLKRYVEKTAANRPGQVKIVRFGGGSVARLRQNYYIRGRGLQVAMRTGGYRQTTSSERLGTQWTVRGERRGGLATEIGNRASYAGTLHGD